MDEVTMDQLGLAHGAARKRLALIAKGQGMLPAYIAESAGYSETTVKAWSRADVDAALATVAVIQETPVTPTINAEGFSRQVQGSAVKTRPIYRNRNDQRIHRNGYLDALQDIVAALNRGGEDDARRWVLDNSGGQVDMAATFDA